MLSTVTGLSLTFIRPPRATPSMLSSAATAALRDIAHRIDLAVQFATGFDYEAFVAIEPRNRPQWKENNLMRRAMLATAVLGGLGLMLLTAVPARAEYGAIAWDAATGKAGASRHEPAAKRAAEAAISECGARRCTVVT